MYLITPSTLTSVTFDIQVGLEPSKTNILYSRVPKRILKTLKIKLTEKSLILLSIQYYNYFTITLL